MINTELLRQKIDESGYKLSYIAKQIGISPKSLLKRINNEAEFRVTEIEGLRILLHLSTEECVQIFFAGV